MSSTENGLPPSSFLSHFLIEEVVKQRTEQEFCAAINVDGVICCLRSRVDAPDKGRIALEID